MTKNEAQNGNSMLHTKELNHPLTFKNIITDNTKGVKINEQTTYESTRADKKLLRKDTMQTVCIRRKGRSAIG